MIESAPSDASPSAALEYDATDALAKAVPNRTGQSLMTCPTTAVFDGLQGGEERIALGRHIRYFGDGFQKSKLVLKAVRHRVERLAAPVG